MACGENPRRVYVSYHASIWVSYADFVETHKDGECMATAETVETCASAHAAAE